MPSLSHFPDFFTPVAHAVPSPAFRGYIREAGKWTDAASEDIGL